MTSTLRVLLVEDDPSHALLIKRGLKAFDATVDEARTIDEAIKILDGGTRPDLIVSDLHLGSVSSIDYLEDLGRRSEGAPILVLTSSTALSDAVEAMKRGARDFIVKNFDKDFNEVLSLSISRILTTVLIEREREKLRRELAVLHEAIENSEDGLAVVDKDGDVTYSNASFQSLEKLIGGPVSERADVKEKLVSLAPGAVWNTELDSLGGDRAFNLRLTVRGTPDLAPVEENRGVIWIRDITEDKRRQKFQREILSTTTHDLKGPLGAILISTELLLEQLPSEGKSRELVLRMASAARGSVNLIDEFLSARRIQEGTLILKPKETRLNDLVQDVVADFRPLALAKNISLEVESSEIEGKVDKLGLTRVIGNILSNAIKFTPKGGRVTVKSQQKGEDIHIEISDNGQGMEPKEVQTIFERFSRLAKHSEVSGSGLGLFVVKCIVNAHGGRVDVTSAVGHGTTFDIVIPTNPPVNERGELISLEFAG